MTKKQSLSKEKLYHRKALKVAIDMAWPAIVESFFIAFAALVDALMVGVDNLNNSTSDCSVT